MATCTNGSLSTSPNSTKGGSCGIDSVCMTKAALYARVSSDAQQKEGTIESQVAELKRQIAAAGHVLVKEYIDDGFPGPVLDRPALNRLREEIKTNLFDAVYFLDADRIARRTEPATPSNPSGPRLDLLRSSDVRRVQQRLIDLGFLSGASDGAWGPRSQRALRDFRIAQGLGDGGWDKSTEQQLFSASAARWRSRLPSPPASDGR